MANFPQPSVPNWFTGFINGFNVVTCPQECRLTQNSPMYNKNDNGTHNNIYNIDEIRGYYCELNNGPPIPHTQRPEGYQTKYYFIGSTNWDTGFSAEEVTEDEVYTAPRTSYLFSAFNTGASCVQEYPPDVPAPPLDSNDCAKVQNSLTWFRLNPNLFK